MIKSKSKIKVRQHMDVRQAHFLRKTISKPPKSIKHETL